MECAVLLQLGAVGSRGARRTGLGAGSGHVRRVDGSESRRGLRGPGTLREWMEQIWNLRLWRGWERDVGDAIEFRYRALRHGMVLLLGSILPSAAYRMKMDPEKQRDKILKGR